MIPAILDALRTWKSDLAAPTGHALEVGSYDVNGSPRSVFATDAQVYVGVDIAPGPGVDVILDGERLDAVFGPGSFDTVICCECLEHTVRPWLVVEQLKKVLAPGGLLWVSTPTYGFPLHRHPLDCYRFGEDAYRHWLFAGTDLLRLAHVADALGQPAIVAVGRKS